MDGFEIAITNLNFRTSVDDVYIAFRKFGELTQCRIKLNERNESKGYAFVSFKNERNAADAISAMNGFRLDGHNITVAWSSSKPSSTPRQKPARHEEETSRHWRE